MAGDAVKVAHVAVAIRDGKFRFTMADGQSVDAELKAGQAQRRQRDGGY